MKNTAQTWRLCMVGLSGSIVLCNPVSAERPPPPTVVNAQVLTPPAEVRREFARSISPLAESLNRFAFKIYGHIRAAEDPEANILLSPYSIQTAFLLAHLGMDGETRDEADRALAVANIERDTLYPSVSDLRAFFESEDDDVTLNVANALFLRPGFPFRETYTRQAGQWFDAEINALPETGKPINDWVSEKTRGTIKELVDSDAPIPQDVIAWLLNAVYFYGHWANEFDPEQTRDDTFTNRRGQERSVRMMETKRHFLYYEDDAVQAVALPYRGGNYRMLIFLPGVPFEDFEAGFNLEQMNNARREMRRREVILQMPRFRMEYATGLNEAMQKAGLRKAFGPREADFSRMVHLDKIGSQNVYISHSIHKTFIEVDEKGTEAAAVTGIQMSVTSMPPPPKRVRLDRSFYFMIEENTTGAILFMGRAVDM